MLDENIRTVGRNAALIFKITTKNEANATKKLFSYSGDSGDGNYFLKCFIGNI